MIKSFDELLKKAKKFPSKKVVIPAADTKSSVKAAILAKKQDIADFLLIGNKSEIQNLIENIDANFMNSFEIIDEPDSEKCIQRGIEAIHNNKADLILKGKTDTSQLMKAVLDKENGLQTGNILSDVFLFETKERLTLMSDGGIVLYPNIEEKLGLIKNAVAVAHHLENPKPKVALLCAIEKPNSKMPSTIDADKISKMSKKWKKIGCIVDGPLALDNAISKSAAKIKDIKSPVAGDADILIMPNIEAGNIFGKALTYYAHLRVAHILIGAKAPILITSRADDAETKLLSIALGIICTE